jgi:hypothetical protein
LIVLLPGSRQPQFVMATLSQELQPGPGDHSRTYVSDKLARLKTIRGETKGMADAKVLSNQKAILSNQTTIVKNQKAILSNQNTIVKNQKVILANQNVIKKNQSALEEILKNQKLILAAVSR